MERRPDKVVVQLRLTVPEKQAWLAAAGHDALSPWIRHVVNTHIRRQQIPGKRDSLPPVIKDDRPVAVAADGEEGAPRLAASPTGALSECPRVGEHWRLAFGQFCPVCGTKA
jgi:hypothetical protein